MPQSCLDDPCKQLSITLPCSAIDNVTSTESLDPSFRHTPVCHLRAIHTVACCLSQPQRAIVRMRILLTGADSLTGSHVLNLLVSDRQISVRAIVEAKERAYALLQQHHEISSALDLMVIPKTEVAAPGTFNMALDDHGNPFQTVIHVLTARSSDETDCLARFINFESDAVLSLLASVHQVAKQVRRVVLVTSLTRFARWLATDVQPDRRTGSSIERQTVVDQEYILATSQAGDNIVHDAVSKWWKTSGASFDIVHITSPSCYGPAVRSLETSSDLSEANRQLWNICSSEAYEKTGTSPHGIAQFVDVRVGHLRKSP